MALLIAGLPIILGHISTILILFRRKL